MIATLLFMWMAVFVTHTLYSYKYLYRRRWLDQPPRFHEARKALSAAEIVALLTLGMLLISRGNPLFLLALIAVSVISRFMVKKITYDAVLREMAALQRGANPSWSQEKAMSIAKTLLQIEIDQGRR